MQTKDETVKKKNRARKRETERSKQCKIINQTVSLEDVTSCLQTTHPLNVSVSPVTECMNVMCACVSVVVDVVVVVVEHVMSIYCFYIYIL